MKGKSISKLVDFIGTKQSKIEGLEEQMAYISHYMHNRGTQFEKNYEKGIELYNNLVGRDSETPISDDDCKDFLTKMELNFQPVEAPKFTFIDLFAGIGGFRLAMQAQGGKCVFSSEFNPNAQKTYAHNYGEVPFGDITKEYIKDIIPDSFDVLCGGFPCQAFSIAGYRKGFEDTRGTLFFDIAEIIKKHQPSVAYLENVRNLEGHDNGQTFEVIKNTLIELGYSVYHKVLNASIYGNIPQHRERILIVAFNNTKVPNHIDFKFPEPIELTKTIHDCLFPEQQDEKFYYRESQMYYPQLIKDMTNPNTIYQWRRIYCRENKSNLCPTLTANMGGGGHNVPLILTQYGIRKLTPKECLNFMGYPEQYSYPESISESAKYMQAGNSVVVPMMTRVAEQIAKILL
jgi:DNA (cytosine-5)-methyltransferase 1